jgi:hypothetical protein
MQFDYYRNDTMGLGIEKLLETALPAILNLLPLRKRRWPTEVEPILGETTAWDVISKALFWNEEEAN